MPNASPKYKLSICDECGCRDFVTEAREFGL